MTEFDLYNEQLASARAMRDNSRSRDAWFENQKNLIKVLKKVKKAAPRNKVAQLEKSIQQETKVLETGFSLVDRIAAEVAAEKPSRKFCRRCASDNPYNTKYCHDCGAAF